MRQLSGGEFGGTSTLDACQNVGEALKADAARQELEKKIGKLERQLKSEKQINRQFEISSELRKLKRQLKGQ